MKLLRIYKRKYVWSFSSSHVHIIETRKGKGLIFKKPLCPSHVQIGGPIFFIFANYKAKKELWWWEKSANWWPIRKDPRNLNLLHLTQNQWLHYYEDWVKYYITNINAIRKKIRIGRAHTYANTIAGFWYTSAYVFVEIPHKLDIWSI